MITQDDFEVYYSGAARSIRHMAAAGLSIEDLVEVMLAMITAEGMKLQSDIVKAAITYARSKGMKNQEVSK